MSSEEDLLEKHFGLCLQVATPEQSDLLRAAKDAINNGDAEGMAEAFTAIDANIGKTLTSMKLSNLPFSYKVRQVAGGWIVERTFSWVTEEGIYVAVDGVASQTARRLLAIFTEPSRNFPPAPILFTSEDAGLDSGLEGVERVWLEVVDRLEPKTEAEKNVMGVFVYDKLVRVSEDTFEFAGAKISSRPGSVVLRGSVLSISVCGLEPMVFDLRN